MERPRIKRTKDGWDIDAGFENCDPDFRTFPDGRRHSSRGLRDYHDALTASADVRAIPHHRDGLGPTL